MSSLDRRLADWFLITAEVLQRPIVEVPLDDLRDSVLSSFDARMATSNLRDKEGRVTVRGYGWSATDPDSHEANRAIAELFRVLDFELFDYHPLLQWYARTGDTAPQSVGRVPPRFLDAWQTHEVYDLLRGLRAEQQLSIPMLVRGIEHQAVVVCRPGLDFTDDDLELARFLQRMFTSLQRQAEILAARAVPEELASSLSGRELAVLRLIAGGSSAQAAARELGVSPRTVEKHLEHVYRKIGVRDRVSAALIAYELGLVDSDRPARPHTQISP
ncbi:helix-turn-helix transcriptional regulator [Microbacterium sp. 4R-513]|uniref:helix-turn-helix domain-containing protein n=1 Tax=Microbacterium sp. 4R-513 TaxID=2567934 RepID=UPI0013E1152D|nr:helix-turn-helix transcriptional regulator [Microbacterium sp. 4R-513]QIG38788.1 helix-turn-helix transcriptional regulator [Microbacterium sp. 4R-513]